MLRLWQKTLGHGRSVPRSDKTLATDLLDRGQRVAAGPGTQDSRGYTVGGGCTTSPAPAGAQHLLNVAQQHLPHTSITPGAGVRHTRCLCCHRHVSQAVAP
jgi:hypothetical protein